MQSLYPSDLIINAALTKHRPEIERAAAEGRRHLLVIDVTFLDALGQFVAHLNTESHNAPAGSDKFTRDVARAWAGYDPSQVVPIIIVNVLQPFTGLMLQTLPWLGPEGAKPYCAHCGSTTAPCAGTRYDQSSACGGDAGPREGAH